MADDTTNDTLSWSAFVDSIAGPLRLESPARQAYGLLATLHLVEAVWGDLAFLRAAARLIEQHSFAPERLQSAPDTPLLRAWFGKFLAQCAAAQGHADVPLPGPLLKPAWIADGEARR